MPIQNENQANFEAVKPVLAVLFPQAEWPNDLIETIEAKLGRIEWRNIPIPFSHTEYYAQEMGTQLWRGLISLSGLISAENLLWLKIETVKLEAEYNLSGKRRYNIDAGFLDADKFVLASTKRGPLKLYLGHGIFADLALQYRDGKFSAFPWSFSDFQDGRYEKDMQVIRAKFKAISRQFFKNNPLNLPYQFGPKEIRANS
jgi:hypothetical protein